MAKRGIAIVVSALNGVNRAAILPSRKAHISHDLACISSTASRRCSCWSSLSPYFLYQALRHKKYVGSLGSGSAICPCRSTSTATVDLDSRRVGGRGAAARPCHPSCAALSPLRLFLSTTTLSGQQLARRSVPDVDGVFYFPFDWTFTSAARSTS